MTEAPADVGSGARLADELQRRLTRATVLANATGALVTFFAVGFLGPIATPDALSLGVSLRNFVAGALYVGLALVIGIRVGNRRARHIREWLRSGRPPGDAEREMVLSQPYFNAALSALFWGVAAVLVALFNIPVSLGFAGVAFVTTVCGGLTTTALVYLFTERINRPVFARVLEDASHTQPVGPSVAARLTTTWMLASGIPLLGVLLISISALAGVDLSRTQIAAAALFLGLVSIVIGALGMIVSAKSVADPLAAVRLAVQEVERGNFGARVAVDDASEVGLLQAGFNRMAAGLEERERVRDLFGRQVGREVAEAALDGEVELGGEVRDVAVLFVDVVGSTDLAARRPPEEVVELLNRFFAIVVEVAERHGGWVNKFEGDAALCVFGAPVPVAAAPSRALAAARELRSRLSRELPEIDAGIGVSAGPAVAGNVGAEQRYEYTVIGDPVNEAARLCELAKQKEERVVASQRAIEAADPEERRHWSLGETVTLRGRPEPTRLATAASS
jgi:adenylate cyclase